MISLLFCRSKRGHNTLRCCDKYIQTYNKSRRKKLTNDRFVFFRQSVFFYFQRSGIVEESLLIGSGPVLDHEVSEVGQEEQADEYFQTRGGQKA